MAMAIGALLFPMTLCALENQAFSLIPLPPLVPEGGTAAWFNLVLFGAFFLTGLSLPVLHAVTRGSALRTSGIFALCWFPVQNFMVVFGWDPLGGLGLSLISLIPIWLVAWVSDRVLGEG